MKDFWKENYRLLLVALAALIAGFTVGLAVGGGIADEAAAETPVLRIGEETRMERIVSFSGCKHETSVPMDAAAYFGYTREELAAHFPDASIIRFDADEVRVMQAKEGYCPRHYVLRLRDDGRLGVTRTDDAHLTEELVTLVSGESAPYQSVDRERLSSGLAFDSLSEIDSYLESMGS